MIDHTERAANVTCMDCEKIQAKGEVAYYRLGTANIGILACDRHAAAVMGALDEEQGIPRRERAEVLRLKEDVDGD